MHEDGAAPPLHARAVVVSKHENQVVEIVVASQAVGAGSRGQFDEPVVAAIGGILAPTIVGSNGAPGEYPPPPPQAVRAVEDPANLKSSNRGGARPLPP